MKTTIYLNNGDYLVADLIERNCDKIKAYCRYMSECLAIDLYLNGSIEGYEVDIDSGVILMIDVEEVYSMKRYVEQTK